MYSCTLWGFPGGVSDKVPTCQCKRHKRCRFKPWVGKIPWRRAWKSTPVFSPGEFHGHRSLECYSPWGYKELDTMEWLTLSLPSCMLWGKDQVSLRELQLSQYCLRWMSFTHCLEMPILLYIKCPYSCGSVFGSLFHSTNQFVSRVPPCLNYYNFIINFDTQKGKSSHLVLFQEAVLGLLCVHINFRINSLYWLDYLKLW